MNAILFQSMPPLSPDEYSALEQSIKAHGIQVPILVDENGIVIDGHHRQKIAQHLGIKCPANVATGKSPAEKRTLSLSLNLDRRHLNREQRRTLVAESIKVDPGLSDRLHAQRAGVSPTTVGTIRGELVASGAVSSLDTRVGADGVQQPAAKPTREHLNQETGELVPESLDEFQRRVLADAERTGTRVPLTGPGSVATPHVTGLDGKSYPRPEPTDCKQPEPALAMPQPPKYGVRRGPAKVLERVTTALSGLVIATEGISDLSTLTDEQADRATADLSKAIRELNRIKNLITKERTK